MLLCLWFHASKMFTMSAIIQASLSDTGNLSSIFSAAFESTAHLEGNLSASHLRALGFDIYIYYFFFFKADVISTGSTQN